MTMEGSGKRALVVDLNNFARYPTLAVGYLVAALRRGGFDAEVLTPLSHGVPPVQREGKETGWEHFERRVYFSTHPLMTRWHDFLRARRSEWKGRPHPLLLAELGRRLDSGSVDVILLSAYVDQYPTVRAVGELAAGHGVPVLVGGPVFNIPGIAAEWLDIPGLAAVVGAEVDLTLGAIVDDLLAGRDLTKHPGVFLPDGRAGRPAPPLTRMDELPIPDFRDFPWDRYPGRVVPLMTGRGCSWGRCLFCADIATANGRSYRSRPVDAVLHELETQAERYDTKDFIFLDLKLNSNLEMWHAICDGFQKRLPGARWIGWIHVQSRGDNGLSRRELEAAREAGLTRTTFGFETGSQRLNDSMAKGTNVDETSRFIRDAHAAGISVRMTAMVGYPGETKHDLDATIRFLETHVDEVDRVRVGLFKPIPGSGFQERYDGKPSRYPGVTRMDWDFRYARAEYDYEPARDRGYRRAKTRLLGLIHDINRRPLPAGAQVFDGLM
jgi:anaerobic magnesium-protoporphyrin IX monomethyl ester cyclase